MTDFIDALEEQLMTAHRDRKRRRFAMPSWRRGAALVGAAGAAAAAVVVVLALSSTDEPQPAAKPAAPPPGRRIVVSPTTGRQITVAVLNGTTVTGLARVAADRLLAAGYREGRITNDPNDQSRVVSEVAYEDGARAAAQDVARRLGIAHVVPMTANGRVLADRAPVAVFIGADKAQ